MPILTDSEPGVTQQFGQPVMAQNLINGGDVFKGEKAYEYRVGDFRMIAGFYQDVCRYVCFRKAALAEPAFTPVDVKICLMLIAPLADWKNSSDIKTTTGTAIGKRSAPTPERIGARGITTDYECTIKNATGSEVGVLAWHCTTKSYLFAFCPAMPFPNQAIAASPLQIDGRFV